MNHLFKTNFKMMDTTRPRCQTTNGIWMANYASNEQHTLIMDVEGSDGKERGQQDNTTFEKQSALFALAVSDIVLINMWYHDIGRENAANTPLLRIVFTEIMKLFTSRKVTLLLVIRDTTSQITFENLETGLNRDMNVIWDSLLKPEKYMNSRLSEFFNVQVVALSHYELQKEMFKTEVTTLRHRLDDSLTSGGLVGYRGDVVPASGFFVSVENMWKIIKENKDLDMPAHKVMVATMRCDEIANKKFESFKENETWKCLEKEVETGTTTHFGNKIEALVNGCLTEYDKEAELYDGRVRDEKKKWLLEKLLQTVKPSWDSMMEHLQSNSLETFKEEFGKCLGEGKSFPIATHICTESFNNRFQQGCADATITLANWDISKLQAKRHSDILDYIAQISDQALARHEAKLSELREKHSKEALEQAHKLNEAHLSRERDSSASDDNMLYLKLPFFEVGVKKPWKWFS